MAVSYPIYNITPCCDFLGNQLDNFAASIGSTGIEGTLIYEGSEQTLNGIIFKPGYCYTVTQVGFGVISAFFIDFNLFNEISESSCESLECESCELPSCYELTKCGETTASIISNSSTLFQFYENDKIVKLAGYEGCYTINVVENCDCAVSVTVTQSYDSCEDCLPVIAYKFTNCDNPSLIQYSTNDYSEYVGKTVELECGGCWIVSEINITPPSTQDPVIQYVFDNCAACKANYYELSDCLDPNGAKVYTATDLSNYLEKIIKIEGCNKCFSISTTREPVNPTNVVVVNNYINCPECLETFPCNCTQVSNTTTETQTYCYLDCDFNEQSIILEPGETSDKICVIDWIACPSNYCNCLTLELGFIYVDDETIYNFKLEKTTLIKNGKPVYNGIIVSENLNLWEFTLSYEFDNCWYSFFTAGINNDAEIPPFILCEDIDCPIGEWTLAECACINVTFTTDSLSINTSLLLTSIDNNNNYVYQDGGGGLDYEISYNVLLGRWEFKDYQTDELLAYYVTSSKCPYTGTTEPISWTVVNLSNTFSVNGFCTFDEQEIIFNTTQCLQECECINMALTVVDDEDIPFILYGVLQPTGNIVNGKTEYEYNTVAGIFIISWDSITNCWLLKEEDNIVATLCNSLNVNCPIGTWVSTAVNIINVVSEFCTDETTTVGTTTLPEYIQNFGSCIDGACPVEILPKRKVKPGYSTPTCDIEKYEKITCRSSEILYKEVMRLRYGLTNCCPEDDEKWLIKKELIDLDALRDPDYICKPTTSCCNQPITSCGCGCNSTLKTCNS